MAADQKLKTPLPTEEQDNRPARKELFLVTALADEEEVEHTAPQGFDRPMVYPYMKSADDDITSSPAVQEAIARLDKDATIVGCVGPDGSIKLSDGKKTIYLGAGTVPATPRCSKIRD